MAATQLIPVPGLPMSDAQPGRELSPEPVAPAPTSAPAPMAATQQTPMPGFRPSEEPARLPMVPAEAPAQASLAATQLMPLPTPRPSEDPTRLPVAASIPPPMEATQRIPAQVPIKDEHPSLATNPGLVPLPDLTDSAPSPATDALPSPTRMPDAITLHAAPDASPEPAPVAPRKAPMWPWFLGGMVLMVALVGGFLLVAFRPRGDQHPSPKETTPAPQAQGNPQPGSATPQGAPEAPQELKPYLDKAAGGDTKAMRMLGAFYTYGLNVPANREEGLRWYRKAAEAGDATARQELQQLEGKP